MDEIKILIVDDNIRWREDSAKNLTHWGYTPIVAEGFGGQLMASAIAKAFEEACFIALIDYDLYNRQGQDSSGLDLVVNLRPTESIIVTGYPNRRRAVDALKNFGAASYVGKEDGPETLHAEIKEVLGKQWRFDSEIQVVWSKYLSQYIGTEINIFKQTLGIGEQEINVALGRLFSKAKSLLIDLLHQTNAENRSILPHIRSMLFRAQEERDNHGSWLPTTVRISSAERVRQEYSRYNKYVQDYIQADYHAPLLDTVCLWNVGVAKYALQGDDVNASAQQFSGFYRDTDDRLLLRELAQRFFDVIWKTHLLRQVRNRVSLAEALDLAWGEGKLEKVLGRFASAETTLTFHGLGNILLTFRHPAHYVRINGGTIGLGDQPATIKTATVIAHNDLHADNLLVTTDGATLRVIDFERTGEGPIAQDYTQLEVDIVTRLAKTEGLPYLKMLVTLVDQVAKRPEKYRHWNADDTEVAKAMHVVQGVREVALQQGAIQDVKLYLWLLLVNCLYRASILHVLSQQTELPTDVLARYVSEKQHTLLFACVLMTRLETGVTNANWWRKTFGELLDEPTQGVGNDN